MPESVKVLRRSLAWNGGPWPDRLTLVRGDNSNREYVPQAERDRLRAVGEEALKCYDERVHGHVDPAQAALAFLDDVREGLKSYREAVPE